MAVKCPVCGKRQFDDENDFKICPICGWENDGVQAGDPDYEGGANGISLNQARADYREA